jgi:hypothetical protein
MISEKVKKSLSPHASRLIAAKPTLRSALTPSSTVMIRLPTAFPHQGFDARKSLGMQNDSHCQVSAWFRRLFTEYLHSLRTRPLISRHSLVDSVRCIASTMTRESKISGEVLPPRKVGINVKELFLRHRSSENDSCNSLFIMSGNADESLTPTGECGERA